MNIFKDIISEMTYEPIEKLVEQEAVRKNALVMLEPTLLQGEQIGKWYNGVAEDKALIPNGYAGDPKGSQYIETNLKEADRRVAMDIVNSFGKQTRKS